MFCVARPTDEGCLTSTPMILGTIFQSDQCLDCNTTFVIGTGDYGTVLANNLPLSSSPDFLADWQTLGTSIGASIDTFIQSSYSNTTITVTTPAPATASYDSTFQVAATATSQLPVAITVSGACSGSGSGSATITMLAGTGVCTISLNQAGDGVNYAAAPQVSESTTAGLAVPTVTFTVAPVSAAYQSSYPVSASTNASTLPSITGTGTCTAGAVSGTAATAVAMITMTSGNGACTLAARWAADSNYSAASDGPVLVMATTIPPTVSFAGAPASATGGAVFNVLAATNASVLPTITGSGACSAGAMMKLLLTPVATICRLSTESGNVFAEG